MWNPRRSILLSKISTVLFMSGVLVFLVAAPRIVMWLRLYYVSAALNHPNLLYATLYVGGAVAEVMLAMLYLLLNNMSRDEIFVDKNVSLLRGISWLCITGAGIALVSAAYYLPWAIVAVAAAFMALIVRVLKNILARATQIKKENDFTI